MHLSQNKMRRSGFTLVEIMIAVAILAIGFVSTSTAMQFHRVQSRKAMEQAIALDFLNHYLELARNQPYASIATGQPINALFDGSSGSANIRFPASSAWVSLETNAYRTFHPDLQWLTGRQPQLSCTISTQAAGGGGGRARRILCIVRWDPPLGQGQAWQTVTLETTVYPDFH